jgi:hypothetical protein
VRWDTSAAGDGLVSVVDLDADRPTYLLVRGEERNPKKDEPLSPAVPAALGGKFDVTRVDLPAAAYYPGAAGGGAAGARRGGRRGGGAGGDGAGGRETWRPRPRRLSRSGGAPVRRKRRRGARTLKLAWP